MEANEQPVEQKICMLTTSDNPYDPFDDYLQWSLFDIEHGYQTSERLAAIANTSDQLSDEENAAEIERAIDEIIKYCPLFLEDGRTLYKKVSRPMDS